MVVSTVTSQHEGPGWIEVCTFSLCVHVFYLVSSNSPNTCIFRAGGDSMINESEKYVSCDRMDTVFPAFTQFLLGINTTDIRISENF